MVIEFQTKLGLLKVEASLITAMRGQSPSVTDIQIDGDQWIAVIEPIDSVRRKIQNNAE